MARLPVVAGDSNAWGTILNTFLQVAHNADGSLVSIKSLKDPAYGAKGDGVTDDTTAINAALASGNVIIAPPGTYLFSSTLLVTLASTTLIGFGIGATTFTTTTSGIDGFKIGNTQVNPNIQLNNIVLRDFTINLPNTSTGSCLNATGMGEGGELTNIKAQQGKYGFLLEDIDRCVFTNLEAVNQNTVSIVCRQGFNNTWGTASFVNCHSVLNTASSIGLLFDNDTVTQLSPNKFDRVSLFTHHFYANPGVAGTIGVKFLVGATATSFINCLYENTLRHNDIEAEVDASWQNCSLINVNFGSTPTTDGWYLNSYAQISLYDMNLQQMTNLFNGVSGNPRVGVWGINKSGGNITNMFTGTYGAKFGNDTVLVGDNLLALGLNGQQMSYVFTHNLSGGPPLAIFPNADSTTGITLAKAGGAAVLTVDTTNGQLISAGSVATPVASKTGAYTLTAADSIVLANVSSAGFTLTLPTAVGCAGRRYTIKKDSSAVNTLTVATTSSQTIDGATTKTFTAAFSSMEVVSDGANWQIV